jgi:hypothetical protein
VDGANGTPGTGKADLTNGWVLTGTSEEDKKFEDAAIEIGKRADAGQTEKTGVAGENASLGR